MDTPTICCHCRGSLQHKAITHQQPWGNELRKFENLPALVCQRCGEVFLEAPVAQLIEDLLNNRP